MKSSLWFEASMLALVLLISLMSVAVEQHFARQNTALTQVASKN
jgi:hypothetical protein